MASLKLQILSLPLRLQECATLLVFYFCLKQCHVAQIGFEPILLALPLRHWDHRHTQPATLRTVGLGLLMDLYEFLKYFKNLYSQKEKENTQTHKTKAQ